MANVYEFVGKFSDVPYLIKDEGIRIRCLTELCVYIEEAAGVLEDSFMCPEMEDFIDKGCGLPLLCAKLKNISGSNAGLHEYVSALLTASGLYGPFELKRITQLVRAGKNFNAFEKRKARGDYLLKKGNYSGAHGIYLNLLSTLPRNDLRRGQLEHNCGAAYAGLMLYRHAAECFNNAYAILKRRESLAAYYAAMRLSLGENAYTEFCLESSLPPEALKCNEQIDALNAGWAKTPQYLLLKNLLNDWDENRMTAAVSTIKEENRA